jgi:hypothetical protein
MPTKLRPEDISRVVAVLRRSQVGLKAEEIAAQAGLKKRHGQRALKALKDRGEAKMTVVNPGVSLAGGGIYWSLCASPNTSPHQDRPAGSSG